MLSVIFTLLLRMRGRLMFVNRLLVHQEQVNESHINVNLVVRRKKKVNLCTLTVKNRFFLMPQPSSGLLLCCCILMKVSISRHRFRLFLYTKCPIDRSQKPLSPSYCYYPRQTNGQTRPAGTNTTTVI